MVEQAEAENVLLYKKDGTRYQSFKYLLIKPDEKLNNTLDFSTQAVQSAIEQGRRQAEKALNKSRNPLRLAA
jgi:predicted ATPase